jgi:hypothetical protein
VDGDGTVLHLFLVNAIGGTTVVLLLESEPGVVELPRFTVTAPEMDDEARLVQRIRETTGIEAEVGGFIDPPPDAALHPAGGRILLARVVSGAPRLTIPHVGWEWTPGAQLVTLPFAPKVMVDELKSFMNV